MLIGHENDNEVSSSQVIGKTKKGKELALIRDKATGMFRIHFTSGGELPVELAGLFNFHIGKAAIETYLAKKDVIKTEPKEEPKKE